MAAPTLRPLSLGEVLDVSFGVYRSMFVPLLVVAVACQLIPTLFAVYLQTSGLMFEHLLLFLAYIVVSAIASSIGIAATTIIVSDAYLGRRTSAGEALGRAAPLLWRLIVISILTGLVVFLGFLLLIVPGIILFAGLALGSVVMVLETPPGATDAMGRSWELTRGYRSKVFWTVLLAFVLVAIPGMAVSGIWNAVGGGETALAPHVLGAVLQVFVYPYVYTVITLLYYDLRVRKEGFDLELLAKATQPG